MNLNLKLIFLQYGDVVVVHTCSSFICLQYSQKEDKYEEEIKILTDKLKEVSGCFTGNHVLDFNDCDTQLCSNFFTINAGTNPINRLHLVCPRLRPVPSLLRGL